MASTSRIVLNRRSRYSFDSRKGPSVNIASSPRLSMTVAELGAARPPAKTHWPSALSWSLNALMAAISSGVARPAVSSITETRYCISDHLPVVRGAPRGRPLTLLRTPLPRSDTASRMSFKTSGTPVVSDPTRRSHRWTPAPAVGAAGGLRSVAAHLDLPVAGLRLMSRASAGCILRAPGRPVDLDRYALRVGSRVDQVKRNVRAGVGEQPRALAEDYGDDEQVHLVDEVVIEQPPDQGATAVHLQLTLRLRFQLADGRRDVAGEDGRVRPARFGER